MRRFLIIKMSSLGDVLHLLPSLTDVKCHHSDVRFDWVVEKSFADIAQLHSMVDTIIPIELRKWRKSPWQALTSNEWSQFKSALKARNYEGVIDAQGLIKSALIARLARGPSYGFDKTSAREPLSSVGLDFPVPVPRQAHAIDRLRLLFASIFNYQFNPNQLNFNISVSDLNAFPIDERYRVFLHGTTWSTKHWPIEHWIELAQHATCHHEKVYLPWGTLEEKKRAEVIQLKVGSNVVVLPKLALSQLIFILAKAKGIISVDTGLGHIGAALNVPILSLYGPTHSQLTGARGLHSEHFKSNYPCAPCLKKKCKWKPSSASPPCMAQLTPQLVWERYTNLEKSHAQAII